MRALLVDDEPHNCELIETLIGFHLPDKIEVIGHAYTVDSAIAILENESVDIVFLDIQMPGKNGFELLRHFKEPDFEVIFVTSYDDYALPAFQADAVAYLLKPVAVEELKRAVDKAFRMRLAKQIANPSEHVLFRQSGKIPVHEGDKVLYIGISEIIFLVADGRYTDIVLESGHQHTISKNLKLLEDIVSEEMGFRRINRSVILNMSFVRGYSKSEPYTIVMSNGETFEISRRRRSEILSELKSARL